MAKGDEIRFACIGCGAWNPASAGICAGCGHPYRWPESAFRCSPRELPDPREARPGLLDAVRTVRIGTGMVLISLIAVILAAFRADNRLGVAAGVLVGPASVASTLAASLRRLEGRPMELGELTAVFFATMVAVVGVALASAAAYAGFQSDVGSGFGVVLILGTAAVLSPTVAARRWLEERSTGGGDLVAAYVQTAAATVAVGLSTSCVFLLPGMAYAALFRGQEVFFMGPDLYQDEVLKGLGSAPALAWAIWLTRVFIRVKGGGRPRPRRVRGRRIGARDG